MGPIPAGRVPGVTGITRDACLEPAYRGYERPGAASAPTSAHPITNLHSTTRHESAPQGDNHVRSTTDTAHDRNHHVAARRISTETKASFKTTELIAYVAAVLGVLIACRRRRQRLRCPGGVVLHHPADDRLPRQPRARQVRQPRLLRRLRRQRQPLSPPGTTAPPRHLEPPVPVLRLTQRRPQRQPSPGATCRSTLSRRCRLYSTPSWFGIVSSRCPRPRSPRPRRGP